MQKVGLKSFVVVLCCLCCLFFVVYVACSLLFMLLVLCCLCCLFFVVYVACSLLFVLLVFGCLCCLFLVVYVACSLLFMLLVCCLCCLFFVVSVACSLLFMLLVLHHQVVPSAGVVFVYVIIRVGGHGDRQVCGHLPPFGLPPLDPPQAQHSHWWVVVVWTRGRGGGLWNEVGGW